MRYLTTISNETKLLVFDLILLLSAAFGLTLWQTRGHSVPFEDAAMLLRYADNFANGHGIVWNIGEPPVDGATDFLFMLLIGLLAKSGLSVEIAARVLIIASHLATVVAVYLFSRRWHAFTSRHTSALRFSLCSLFLHGA
jgi:hypothetical protein